MKIHIPKKMQILQTDFDKVRLIFVTITFMILTKKKTKIY